MISCGYVEARLRQIHNLHEYRLKIRAPADFVLPGNRPGNKTAVCVPDTEMLGTLPTVHCHLFVFAN
ncbi:MAG: hypothetical protein KAR13_06695 [Desulfobulbaceae bacterium]|nr:hypothetical protein [Desulfobulbaceae bacterium]